MKTATKVLCWLTMLLCGSAGAQVAAISGQVLDQNGQPLPFADVRICSVTSTGTPCTPTAPIFLDYGLTNPAPNPTQADQFGNYTFYAGALAPPNLYVVELSPTSGITWTYVVNGPYCSLAGCSFSGPVTATIFNATQSPYYEINGTQISSAALSDAANLAKLNVANVFTASPQTAPIFNATTQFNVNGTQIACTNLSDCANLAKINASNTFTGTVQTAPVFNASTGFRIGGAAATNHVLLGNGTNYVDSATIPYSIITGGPPVAPFAGVGIVFATSTTASTVATSPQIVTALNNTPSSTLAPALLPLATTAAFGAVKCDGTTITCTSGVIASVAPTLTSTQTDVTGSRAFGGGPYQNTSGAPMVVDGWAVTVAGGADGNITCTNGPTSGLGNAPFKNNPTATDAGGNAYFHLPVPSTWWYQCTATGTMNATLGKWYETVY